MNRVEFLNYIKNFNKKPGEFTRDEIYEIGVNHKSLPTQDKSWSFLVDALGWEGSSESLRCYINSRMKKEGILPSRTEAEDAEDNSFEDLYIEKTKVRDSWNAYRKTLRDEARIESLKEEMHKAVKTLEKLPKVKPAVIKGEHTTEAVLNISDLHIGPEFTNSVNSYSCDEAVNRLNKLVSDTIYYCKINNVRKLHCLNLGDLIAGMIHETIRLEQSIDLCEQIMKAAELMSEALNQLQAAAPVVTYRSVTDNHSRAMANKAEHIEKENFNRLIDWFIEERLKNTNVQFPHDNVDIGIGRFELDNGKVVVFMHGHEDRRQGVVQDMIGILGEIPDYVMMAHYHNSSEHTFQKVKVYVNGSIIGTDTYAYSKRLVSDPAQKLIIFDEPKNIIDIDIYVK